MNKEDVVYNTIEYYSARKKDKFIPFAITRKDLERIMLSAISHTEKDKHHMISLMWNIKKHMDKENSSVVTRGKRVGSGHRGEGEHLCGDSQEIMYN